MFKKLVTVMALCAVLIPTSALAQDMKTPKVGLSKDLIYFVFPDRYRNGDTSNDLAGGTTIDPTSGYDPTSTAHFHGGDLKGLTGSCEPGDDGLARIKSMEQVRVLAITATGEKIFLTLIHILAPMKTFLQCRRVRRN